MSALASQSTVLLVRHAHTEMAGRFCGHSDPDLSPRGQQQLEEIAQRIAEWPFASVYSSSLMRARRTAQAVAASRGLEVNVRSGLNEIDFGAWEGRSWSEIESLYPEDAARWLNHHPTGAATDGEPFAVFQSRVLQELQYAADAAQNSCVVIVTHAGFIRTALVAAAGMSAADAWKLPLDYGSITELNYLKKARGSGIWRRVLCAMHVLPENTHV